MVKLLFDDDDDDYLKLGSLCLKFSSDKPKINAVKFIADHQLINESLNLHFDPLPEDFKQYSEYLFKILTTGGFRKAKVFNRSLKDDVLFYWIINHIETSTDLTKMVANIVLHFDGWSDLNLSERAENLKESTENSISYEFSNIHNPKMKYDVLLYKRSDVKVDSVTIKKMWGDNVGFKDNDVKLCNII
uniref:BTB domain-containing protein n=1 Tax=Meloidogyne hapla TaxID=6305 RepID=A0A1I8BJW5_MELHA